MRRFACVITAIALVGCARGAHHAPAESRLVQGQSAEVRAGYDVIRAATAKYVSLDSAIAAGYPPTVAACISHPQHGVMGYHHVNRAFVDAKVELERPEILLYDRRPDGSYRYNGVEYIIPFRVWPRDSVPPKLLGMDMKREEDLKLWYMHMWLFTENPSGLFADYHPGVICPPVK